VEYESLDQKPVHIFFLIVAPPIEVSHQYLPVLGRIAQLGQMPDIPERLRAITDPAELFRLLDERGA
jgi:mannitol/fructose-specific phosphotransferase system IIA component (Ntr-type)